MESSHDRLQIMRASLTKESKSMGRMIIERKSGSKPGATDDLVTVYSPNKDMSLAKFYLKIGEKDSKFAAGIRMIKQNANFKYPEERNHADEVFGHHKNEQQTKRIPLAEIRSSTVDNKQNVAKKADLRFEKKIQAAVQRYMNSVACTPNPVVKGSSRRKLLTDNRYPSENSLPNVDMKADARLQH